MLIRPINSEKLQVYMERNRDQIGIKFYKNTILRFARHKELLFLA